MTTFLDEIRKEQEALKKKTVEQMIKDIDDAKKQNRLTIEKLLQR